MLTFIFFAQYFVEYWYWYSEINVNIWECKYVMSTYI